MRCNFTEGFQKTAGPIGSVVGAVTKPVKWAGKLAVKAGGGPLNTALTGLGAVMEGSSNMKKMTDAATRG